MNITDIPNLVLEVARHELSRGQVALAICAICALAVFGMAVLENGQR